MMGDKVAMQDSAQPGNSAALRTFAVLLACALPIQIIGRAGIAGVVLVALLCFLSLPQKSTYVKRAGGAARGPVGIMLLITLIFWLPNAFYSIDPLRSLEAALRTFVYIGFATLCWAVLVENRQIHSLLLRAFVLASSLAIIVALVAQTAVPELYWFLHFRGWADIPLKTGLKPFSALAVFMIPALLWAGIRLRGPWVFIAAINIIGFLALVWLTYNRAAIAGLLAMTVLAGVWASLSNYSRPIKAALLIGVALALAAVLIWLNVTRQRFDLGEDWLFPLWLIDYQRQTIWQFAFDLFQQNFWFGLGVNTINFAPGADAIIPQTVQNLTIIPSHPHNWVLEVATETGILGLLALLGTITVVFARYFRTFIQYGDGAYFVTACIGIGYWVSGLFNFSFWSSWWQMSFVLMSAICLSQSSCAERPKGSHGG